FFTLVVERRAPLFERDSARRILGNVIRRCRDKWPFEVIATVLLPDHLHAIWTLPPGDDRYSTRWNWIKGEFTKAFLATGGREQPRQASRVRERRRSVWQRRFWEHTIRDEVDLENHFDYIHYNAVKHGYVGRPRDWRWSTFRRWVESGHYPIDWGANYIESAMPGNAGE
ncbi:MAG TPA: transposase, partial [Pirellulales bacterium]|nr:transposase [Pirellulales bacterium]